MPAGTYLRQVRQPRVQGEGSGQGTWTGAGLALGSTLGLVSDTAFLRTNEPYARRGTVSAAHLQKIGAGTRPQCRGGSRADLDHYRSVPEASIDGVSPEIAIAALPRRNIYVRQGAVVPPALASVSWVQWTIIN
jgi:hypothetical protein